MSWKISNMLIVLHKGWLKCADYLIYFILAEFDLS